MIPHEPEPRAHEEPTAGAPATMDGRELGGEGEQIITDEDAEAAGERRESAPSGSSSSSRGPDEGQRIRRTYRDKGDNPERPHDWSNFDIGRIVRIFRTDRTAAIRLSLRKLHVR